MNEIADGDEARDTGSAEGIEDPQRVDRRTALKKAATGGVVAGAVWVAPKVPVLPMAIETTRPWAISAKIGSKSAKFSSQTKGS